MPTLLWGRAAAHLCLGQSQHAACDLMPLDVPVLRRPLGGGAVWVDEDQLIHVLIAPLRHAPRRPSDWAAWALQPAIRTFHGFGLGVERRGDDLWLAGRKIAGTGAATIGGCAVFASSFLLRFPRARFVACMAGSETYRRWLEQGLAATLTDWSEHAPPPPEAGLRAAYCDSLQRTLGWRLARGVVTPGEAAAIAAAEADMDDDSVDDGWRRPRISLKLNAESYLSERKERGRRVRELVVRGVTMRRSVTAV